MDMFQINALVNKINTFVNRFDLLTKNLDYFTFSRAAILEYVSLGGGR